MKFAIDTPPVFRRQAAKFFRQHPELEARFEAVVAALEVNPFDPSLRLHPLSGRHKGLHAVCLTYAYRIALILLVDERHITLIDIGTHDEVYRR